MKAIPVCRECEEPATVKCQIYGCHALLCDQHRVSHLEEEHNGSIFGEPIP